jgi:putative transposase
MEFKQFGLIVKGEKMWQDRFWEETIRDDNHYERCVDYIHYNPVKHGFVESPAGWEHSSIHGFIKKGLIAGDWCDSAGIVIPGAEHD